MTQPITTYLNQIEQNLATGDATEHTHRSTLEALLEALAPDVQAINEPRRIHCGAPDLAVLREGFLVGHVEAKDVGTVLDVAERSEQLQRYREALDNLILTDYVEFRRYVGGDLRQTVCAGTVDDHGRIRAGQADKAALHDLLTDFLAHTPDPIGTPRDLAERMARLAHLIREIIITAFETGRASETLTGWRQAFADVLIAELDQAENVGQFADMFAQTLAYGLFSARVMMPLGQTFTRQTAQALIPRTNPFLRDFFYQITGPRLEEEPYAGFVNDLVQLLAHADMGAILEDFGQRTRQDDPTVHFYETFLAAYDPHLRERRGVYYTPTPVVSFIVRSVDALLKSSFGLPQGLADTRTITLPPSLPPPVEGRRTLPKVLILDPATGTGTFLYSVIAHIRAQFMRGGNAGMWSGFVREHLLPRIFGFELLMAPYAVAHFKLAFQLAGHDLDEAQQARWAYDFATAERIRVYLTNTLEAIEEDIQGLFGPLRIVTEEAKQANQVKRDLPIMVIVGNPPYSISSSNKGEYIEGLMDTYKQSVRSERNIQPLSDDYIKFIRFAHERIERTGHGILGFITNHSYLSGLIHRGMREELLKTFDTLYILNLHGNALMGETAPDGSPDENVFDIRQGVAIALMVKTGEEKGLATAYYADLWGKREDKYRVLNENDVETLTWETLNPVAPYFFLVPTDFSLQEEYEAWPSVTDIFGSGDFYADQGKAWGSGVKTNRDYLLVDFDRDVLQARIAALADASVSDKTVKAKFGITDNDYWDTHRERQKIRAANWAQNIVPYFYRPFDKRWLLYQPNLIEIKRGGASKYVMQHLQQENVALLAMRQVALADDYSHFGVSNAIVDNRAFVSTRGVLVAFPLYIYPEENAATLFDTSAMSPWDPAPAHGNRVPNLAPQFVHEIETQLSLPFTPIQPQRHPEQNGRANAPTTQPPNHLTTQPPNHPTTFGPEDLLAYSYAIFHSPTYRKRYAEFLKIDFPRVPLTSNVDLFWQLVALGRDLIALHLMEHPSLAQPVTSYPIPGDNRVKRRGGYPKFVSAGESRTKTSDTAQKNRVYINPEQYFAGVPEAVWEFQVGGYQVLHKWLKDRRGRVLSYNDLAHYQQIVVALQATMQVMAEVDAAISEWPMT